MAKDITKVIIFGALFVIGLIILLNCINFSDQEITNILNANGGGMDTNKYLIYLEQCITKYRFLGSILSLLGGIGVLMTVNKRT